jgi:hypothetical protein
MSLEINENLVNAVLLPDGWHEIKCGSFFIDAYEYRNLTATSLYGLVPKRSFVSGVLFYR